MKEHVNLYRNRKPVVNDAFDKVVVNICLENEKNNSKSFLLCGCEPGVGTTTISVEVAISLSIAGWKTVLIDGDMRKNTNYKRINEQIKKGLTNYIRGNATKEEIICDTNWEKLSYISCGSVENDNPLRMLYSSKLEEIMKELHKEYDYIIIDVPSINASVDSHILSVKTDATILVAALNGSSRKYLEEARIQLEADGANLIGVIENKVKIEEFKYYIKDYDYFNKKRYIQKKKVQKHKDEKNWYISGK